MSDLQYSQRIIDQMITAWKSQNKGVDKFFGEYADDVYLKEVAPKRNRAIYLLGHLVAVNDGLLPLFMLGDKLYPELTADFLSAPDNVATQMPTIAELKTKWKELNVKLEEGFSKMSVEDWMGRHTSVTEEDFAKEPHRNKLNVLISRINHQAYHLGQLKLLNA
ncbi:MAG: DinB family protein [Sphingobacteriales bacterium]|nr:MAG: DinB family protein [Sphingobacteriales bacterium]